MWPEEFFIDRLLTRQEITHACCIFFRITTDDVAVVQSITEDHIPPVLVICEQKPAKGDFAARLCVYPKSSLQHTDSKHFIEQIVDLYCCRCLIGDSSLNPYRWLLVEGAGQITPVFVDVDQFDADDPLVIIAAIDTKDTSL